MTCKQCAELLIDFVSGELSAEFCATVREHMEQCGPCERFLVTYRTTITLTGKLPMAALPAELVQRLQAALREAQNRQAATQAYSD